MNKFEIGTRVIVVAAEDGTQDTDLLGETGTVVNLWAGSEHEELKEGVSVEIDPEFPESHMYGSLFFHKHELAVLA